MGYTMGLPHSSVCPGFPNAPERKGMPAVGGCGFLGLIFTLDRRKDGVRVTEKGEVVGRL